MRLPARERVTSLGGAEAAIVVISLLTTIPFLGYAFHVDEPNFLALARHSVPNPLRLYDFPINWIGTTERAFDVLSNPPLVPWYLAAVVAVAGEREWAARLAFWPFIVLALLGIRRLAYRFVGPREAVWTLMWAAVAPAFVLGSHTVMPDLPLLAAYTFGLSLAIEGFDTGNARRAFIGGLVAGLSALCRYSGMTVIPLMVLYIVLFRVQARGAALGLAGAVAPLAAWCAVSQVMYGEVHALAMAGFQTSTETAFVFRSILHRAYYQLSAIGLTVAPAALLAALTELRGLRVPRAGWRGTLGGAYVAVALVAIMNLSWPAGALLLLGCAGGGAVAGVAVAGVARGLGRRVWTRADDATSEAFFLGCWLLGIVCFNLTLRFASVRYLLLALPPALLLIQRAGVRVSPSTVRRSFAAVAILLLSLALSRADATFANVYRDYVAALPPPLQTRWFVGHWGLQHYLERAGAQPLGLTDWPRVRLGDEIVVPTYAAPQILSDDFDLTVVDRREIDAGPGLRTFTAEGRACFYSSWISPGRSPVVLPFGLSRAPLEVLTRFEVRQ